MCAIYFCLSVMGFILVMHNDLYVCGKIKSSKSKRCDHVSENMISLRLPYI